MKESVRIVVAAAAVSATLVTSGCLGLGGGSGSLGSFFGSNGSDSGDSSGSSVVSLSSTNLGGGSEGGVPPAATLHNPEPASLALFGGGLGVAVWRRRRKARRALRS